jgi:hypothetical protein
MGAALVSPTLSFTRDGRRLIAIDHDAVTITETSRGETLRLAIEMPRAAIGFVDQIWVAHGRTPELSRFGISGARIDVAHALSDVDGELIAAAGSTPAAVWTGRPALAIAEENGAMRISSAPVGDVVVPLTSRRWIIANGARVMVPSGLSCELDAGARVTTGAVVFDGTALLALVERPQGRDLTVIGLSNGRPQLRQAIGGAALRVAARRGLVAVQVESQRLGILDLRSGRLLGEIVRDELIADFALDPDGQRIALRNMCGNVELLGLRDAFETARVAREPGEVVATADMPAAKAEASADPAPAVPHAIPPAAAEPGLRLDRPLALAALVPVEPGLPLERTLALDLLDRETRTVALWALRAITEAWNTRRIGYGNEGQHPYEHEVAALLGMNAGFATEHVAAARAHLAAHEADAANQIDPRDPMLPLGALARELGLSPLALDILLVIAAPALWSEAARLFGILANDPGRALVDEALVIQILDGRANRHDIAGELDPRAPLVRFGIVAVDPPRTRPFAGLTIDPIVLARLRREVPDLGTGLIVRGSDRALEELAVARHVIPDALAALARTTGLARIAVRGRPGSGRRTLLAALAAEAGRALGVIDASLLPRADRAGEARVALRRAQLAGLLPCIVGLELVMTGEHNDRDAFADVLRAHPGPLAVVLPLSEEPPLDAGHVAIDLPVLGENDRLTLWQTALADAGLVADTRVLAARYRVGAGALHRAITHVRKQRDDASVDVTSLVDDFMRQTRDGRLGAHARRVERLATWDSLVLPADIRDSLRELVARVRHRRTVFETWGMGQHIATSRGLTALFSGPPGTGKTLVAGVIARELGLDLYQVELSKLMSKWIGETERNLAAIFDAAEDGQAILLFDEADSLFAKRTEVRSSNDRYANLEVNYLLQRLDSFEGIAILTTNASSAIDPAFKRRMSFRLSFPFPDEETRVELWRAHLPASLPVAGPLALDKLAHKYQLSGGYIRNACLRAAFLAAEDQTALAQAHLERAVALEFAELGKLSTGGSLD